ncbi:MAG: thioredoxin family protein [Chitinophagaceae bacterium]|nr:MAG: thioredoxin family protein [Chitinophagaceae bacterium]
MKKILLIVLFTLTPMLIEAQELKWHTDLAEAMKQSDKTKKPLLLFFTGSDWCGWCIRLQKEVLTTPEFSAWAKENVILVELDFPRRTPQPDAIKAQNAQLQQFFGVRGYPTVWFAKASKGSDNKVNFEQLGKTGYVAGGPSAWLQGANTILKKT